MKLQYKQTKGSALVTLIGGIVILLAVLFFLVKLAGTGYHSDVEAMTPTAVETRIRPAGSLAMGDGTPVGQRQGQQVFDKVCAQCHAANVSVAFAPKLGNNAEWAPRLAQGFDVLVQHAVNGFVGPQGGNMPARGGDTTLTDDEVARAVAYMANQSGGNFTAPAVSGNASDTAGASEAAASGGGASGDQAAAGEAVFNKLCIACHSANSAFPNAPRITNTADWQPRLAQGRDVLVKHAIEGFNTMPAKGGDTSLSDEEVEAAVVYMANQSGGKI